MATRQAGQMMCDCGCGRMEYFHKLKPLEIEVAIDESLLRTGVLRRFMVRNECRKQFIIELQAMHMLEQLVRSYIHHKVPWYRKLFKMRRVVRLQFVIHSRLKGIEATRRQSLRSGILFVAPNWLGKYLIKYWQWSNRNNLVWRWNPLGRDLHWSWFRRLFRTPKPTSTSTTGITKRPSPVCLPSPSRATNKSSVSQ